MTLHLSNTSLQGLKGLVVGVANEHSIAWGCAEAFRAAGAELAVTYLNAKAEPHVRPLAESIDATLIEALDVENDAQMGALFEKISQDPNWGRLDFVLHSIAFAPLDDLHGPVLDKHSSGGVGDKVSLILAPLVAGTLAARIYGGAVVQERHRHRYEVNNAYVPRLEKSGLIISARTPNESLPEMMELPKSMHPWFFGVQFHPEFTSNPRDGHPLFTAFIEAAIKQHKLSERKEG